MIGVAGAGEDRNATLQLVTGRVWRKRRLVASWDVVSCPGWLMSGSTVISALTLISHIICTMIRSTRLSICCIVGNPSALSSTSNLKRP